MSIARPGRAGNVETHETDDGVVVHHTTTRVHHLNAAAAVIFELCDGSRSADGIVTVVQSLWGLAEPPDDVVVDCLNRLRTEGLVI